MSVFQLQSFLVKMRILELKAVNRIVHTIVQLRSCFCIFLVAGIILRVPYNAMQSILRNIVLCLKFTIDSASTNFKYKLVYDYVFICLIIQRTMNLVWYWMKSVLLGEV